MNVLGIFVEKHSACCDFSSKCCDSTMIPLLGSLTDGLLSIIHETQSVTTQIVSVNNIHGVIYSGGS